MIFAKIANDNDDNDEEIGDDVEIGDNYDNGDDAITIFILVLVIVINSSPHFIQTLLLIHTIIYIIPLLP